MREIGAEVAGWVILPNHYYALVGVASLDGVSAALKALHGATAREWNLADAQTGARRVWYKFSHQWIRGETDYYRALNYMHIYPVKHRYVADVYEWPWSSLQDYLDANGREWLRALWKTHPPNNF